MIRTGGSVDERRGDEGVDERLDERSTAPTRGPRAARGEIRRRITEAALRSFADHGLDGSSTRSIARDADCDPALVRYYFASKQQLFDQVTRRPAALDDQLEAMAEQPQEQRAAYLAHLVATCWDDPSTSAYWRSLLRTAATDVDVARAVEDVWSDFVALGVPLAPTGPCADGADGSAAGEPSVDGAVPDGASSSRRRSVVALTSITGMLAAVHLWTSHRARALSQQDRSEALALVLQGCFTAPDVD